MEGRRCGRFFFQDATQGFITGFDFIRKRFPDIYEGGKRDEQGTFGRHFYDAINEIRERRMVQSAKIAEHYGMTSTEINKLPFIIQILKLTKGEWDFIIRIISNEELILEQIKKILNEDIQDMDIIESVKVVYSNPNEKEIKFTNINNVEEPSLNKKQLKLLFELSKNSRESIVNLSVPSVENPS